jgi:casein kinase 1
VKSRRTQERNNSSRDIGSVQPLAPTSRRQSQQQREASALASVGLAAPHPYAAAPSPNGYRNSGHNAYGRQSPSPAVQLSNGHGPANPSDSFLYGQVPGKNGSRDGTMTAGTGPREVHAPGAVRGMAVYDREQMQRVGEQDEDGHGRRKGIFALCCR